MRYGLWNIQDLPIWDVFYIKYLIKQFETCFVKYTTPSVWDVVYIKYPIQMYEIWFINYNRTHLCLFNELMELRQQFGYFGVSGHAGTCGERGREGQTATADPWWLCTWMCVFNLVNAAPARLMTARGFTEHTHMNVHHALHWRPNGPFLNPSIKWDLCVCHIDFSRPTLIVLVFRRLG